MANIPFALGFTPTRWKKGVDVFIEKKNKSFQVDKLRIILLYESDFNFNNKIVGRQALENAEKYNMLAKEQYNTEVGSTKQQWNKF